MSMLRQKIVAVQAGLIFALAPPVYAQSFPPEVQVGTRTIVDAEFDWGRDGVYCSTCNFGGGNNRLAFIDSAGSLWVGHVDVNTGDFVPSNGEGKLADTNTMPANVLGNGPEWMSLSNASALVYDRWIDGQPHSYSSGCLGFAHESNGSWHGGCMDNSQGYVLPLGTFNVGDKSPMVSYQDFSQPETAVYWRLTQTGSPQHEVLSSGKDQNGATRRWVPGTHQLILTAPAPPDASGNIYRQVFLYSTDAETLQQLTFDPTDKDSAFMWQAPEYGNEFVFFARIADTEIDIYRYLTDGNGTSSWQVINRIQSAPEYPYIYSIEPFVYQGKSWLFFYVSALEDQGSEHVTATSQIAMSGIEPGASTFRLLTSDVPDPRARRDPEYYITAKGPYLYYKRYILPGDGQPPEAEGIFRVDTGLGSPPPALFVPARPSAKH